MYNTRLVAVMACLAAFAFVQYSSAEETTTGIKCYVCATTTEDKDCGLPFKKPAATEPEGNSTSEAGAIIVVDNCKLCVVTKISVKDTDTYARTCSSADVTTGCVTEGEDTACISTCDTDLCNVGDSALSLRSTLLTILTTLLLSLLTKF